MAQCDCSASNEHPLLIGTRAGAKVSCSDPRPAAGEKNPVINVGPFSFSRHQRRRFLLSWRPAGCYVVFIEELGCSLLLARSTSRCAGSPSPARTRGAAPAGHGAAA